MNYSQVSGYGKRISQSPIWFTILAGKKNYTFQLFSTLVGNYSLNFPKMKKCFPFLNLPFWFLLPIFASITDQNYNVTIF